MAGVGLLGANDYSTFNIWFFLADQPRVSELTVQNGWDHVHLFLVARQFGELVVDGYPLGEWAMVLTLREFEFLVQAKPLSVKFNGIKHWIGKTKVSR